MRSMIRTREQRYPYRCVCGTRSRRRMCARCRKSHLRWARASAIALAKADAIAAACPSCHKPITLEEADAPVWLNGRPIHTACYFGDPA
jgi:hypothetical protein